MSDVKYPLLSADSPRMIITGTNVTDNIQSVGDSRQAGVRIKSTKVALVPGSDTSQA